MPLNQGQVGPGTFTDGATPTARLGRAGDAIVSELHGRFYEQAYRGNVYSVGHAAGVALSASTILLTSSATPILGVWNPASSPVNLVMLQASLMSFLNNVTSVAPGVYVWAASTGNAALTLGLTPWNRKTLAQSGSYAKGFAGATALTGLTNNLVVMEGAGELPIASGLLTTVVPATTTTPGVAGVQNFDGGFIVPPGGVLALLNTISSTTHTVAGRLTWEEVPT